MGVFDRVKKLSIFSGFFTVSEEFYEELEEALILSDMGLDTAMEAVEELRQRVKGQKLKDEEDVKECLRGILMEMLESASAELVLSGTPAVILFVWVNGLGKTLTSGKLDAYLKGQGTRVLLASGDTFRAAAADQLQIWAERSHLELVRHEE